MIGRPDFDDAYYYHTCIKLFLQPVTMRLDARLMKKVHGRATAVRVHIMKVHTIVVFHPYYFFV